MASRNHVIITGGSRGLGEAIVRRLLAHGYRVSTCSRRKTSFVEEMAVHADYGERFLWTACEIGVAAEVDRFVKDAVTWAGEDGLYGLVNNAAIASVGILATFPNHESERILRVNLLGTIEMARAVSQVLLRQKRRRPDHQRELHQRFAWLQRVGRLLRRESRRGWPDAGSGPGVGATPDHGKLYRIRVLANGDVIDADRGSAGSDRESDPARTTGERKGHRGADHVPTERRSSFHHWPDHHCRRRDDLLSR